MSIRLCAVVVRALRLVVVGGCGGTGGMKNEPGEGEIRPPVNGYAAQPARIYVDEEDGDWEEVSARHDDAGDGDGLDIERLWMAHAEQHLFLRLELGPSIHPQEDNELTLSQISHGTRLWRQRRPNLLMFPPRRCVGIACGAHVASAS